MVLHENRAPLPPEMGNPARLRLVDRQSQYFPKDYMPWIVEYTRHSKQIYPSREIDDSKIVQRAEWSFATPS